jgi:ribosomal protein S18 acetylase RimI-like enzyme
MADDEGDSRAGHVMAVRPARSDDAKELALAHVLAWQSAYPGLMPQDYLDGLNVDDRAVEWRQRLSAPTATSLVLAGAVDERVVGFCSFGAARDPDLGGFGELYALNVHPGYWGEGVGSALLSEAHKGLADLGFAQAILWVAGGNVRARRFYERRGWVAEVHQRTASVQGVTVPEVRYAKRLT